MASVVNRNNRSTNNQHLLGSKPVISVKEARRKDALALARLVYDMYKEEKRSGKISSGQNNAQNTSAK